MSDAFTSDHLDDAGNGAEEPAVADAATDADGGGCRAGSVSAFQPPAFIPIHRSLACNGFNADGGLVLAYGDACFGGSSTYDQCSAFAVPQNPAAEACFRCLVTEESADASAYGVAVIATVPVINYAGCIQALDPTGSGQSCAETVTAAAICAEYACKSTCPVTDQGSQDAYTACWNDATSGACVGYWLRAEACIAAEQGDGGAPVATVCFGGSRPPKEDYLSLARYFCGAN